MIVKVPEQFMKAINEMPFNTTVKKNALKVYSALYTKIHLANKHGFFPVSSEYLQCVNKRYYKIIDYFIKRGLVKPYERLVTDPNDIFNSKSVKYYDTGRGICMKYKFLVDVESGREVDVDMIANRDMRWYSIIYNSLLEYGFLDMYIKRDSFGRRVHHSGIKDYKEDFKGFECIDAVASQPTLLYHYMKENNIVDQKYFEIFESGKDFYKELVYHLNVDSRDEAKELFMFWVNSKGYVPDFNIHNLFPGVSAFIKKYKSGSHKNIASLLQRIESKIWIDDILNNIPVEWAIPIHDSVIIKPGQGDKVLEYIKDKYKHLNFEKKILK